MEWIADEEVDGPSGELGARDVTMARWRTRPSGGASGSTPPAAAEMNPNPWYRTISLLRFPPISRMSRIRDDAGVPQARRVSLECEPSPQAELGVRRNVRTAPVRLWIAHHRDLARSPEGNPAGRFRGPSARPDPRGEVFRY